MKTERLLNSSKRIEMEELLHSYASNTLLTKDNPFITMRTGFIAKLLFYKELFDIIEHIPGSIVEVGCWYGQSSILFENLRAIIEPFNYTRNIISFDTFEGYIENSGLKIATDEIEKYNTGLDWIDHLIIIQNAHKTINNSHTNFINVKGDISHTLKDYFSSNPQVVALVYYDIATYESLKTTFESLINFIPKGGVFVFDDFGYQYEGVNKYIIENNLHNRFSLISSKYYKSKIILKVL